MANLGKFIINTKISVPFYIGDFTSWMTEKVDMPLPGIALNIRVASKVFDFLTYWLVGETDFYTVRGLDQISMRDVDSSWQSDRRNML